MVIKQNAKNKNRNSLSRSRSTNLGRSRLSFSPNRRQPNLHSHNPQPNPKQRILGMARQLLRIQNKPSIHRPICSSSSTNRRLRSNAGTLSTLPRQLRIRLWIWLRTLLGKIDKNFISCSEYPAFLSQFFCFNYLLSI
jgi:hypothetical protein